MKKIVIGIITLVIAFLCFFSIISLTWIGAEYQFDGVVTFGRVDKVIAGVLAIVCVEYLFSPLKKKDEGKYVIHS